MNREEQCLGRLTSQVIASVLDSLKAGYHWHVLLENGKWESHLSTEEKLRLGWVACHQKQSWQFWN